MLTSDRTRTLLARAAQPTLDRIDRERRLASEPIKPMLAAIREQLFDPGFNLDQMRAECDRRESWTSTRFHVETSLPPWTYVLEARLETAARLLRDTSLPVATIGGLVAYYDESIFSRAFRDWCGMPPTTYREKACRAVRRAGIPALEASSFEVWNRLREGTLEPVEAGILIRYLKRIYLSPAEAAATGDLPRSELPDPDRLLATHLVRALDRLSLSRQRQALRKQILFPSPALFQVLLERARRQGRHDRRRGVDLAELALECAYAGTENLGAGLADLLPRAWAWTANARRLAFDLDGAEQALEFADQERKRPGVMVEPAVEAELLDLKAAVRLFQGRYDEAEKLNAQAIALFLSLDVRQQLAQSLAMRAELRERRGDLEGKIDALRAAQEQTDEDQDRYLALVLYHNLASAWARSGHHDQAARLLPQVERLCRRLASRFGTCALRALNGGVKRAQGRVREAEALLNAARTGFLELGEEGEAAAVALDLAILLMEEHRTSEAGKLAAEVIPLVESFGVIPDLRAALDALRAAVDDGEVTTAALREVRAGIEKIRQLPLVWRSSIRGREA